MKEKYIVIIAYKAKLQDQLNSVDYDYVIDHVITTGQSGTDVIVIMRYEPNAQKVL